MRSWIWTYFYLHVWAFFVIRVLHNGLLLTKRFVPPSGGKTCTYVMRIICTPPKGSLILYIYYKYMYCRSKRYRRTPRTLPRWVFDEILDLAAKRKYLHLVIFHGKKKKKKGNASSLPSYPGRNSQLTTLAVRRSKMMRCGNRSPQVKMWHRSDEMPAWAAKWRRKAHTASASCDVMLHAPFVSQWTLVSSSRAFFFPFFFAFRWSQAGAHEKTIDTPTTISET